MFTKKKIISIFCGCLILIVTAILNYYNIPQTYNNLQTQITGGTSTIVISTPVVSTSSPLYTVTRVVDGDTIVIDTGEKVRYIGMNTPETVDPRKPVECFGKEASAYNKQLVLNKKVRLEKDVSETDKYGRLLRFVYLEDGTFVNLKLVEDGYASIMTIPPDVKLSSVFLKAEQQARDAKLGLWSACK